MAELSPMMQQYLEIKKQHKDEILFYRIGDFYEMFFEDALTASKELDLTLTGKQCGLEERAPMCGVPFHSYEGYVARLIAKGYKVAICEQVEDPAKAKGLVKRDIIRVVTPGTVIESSMLQDDRNNYIASIYLKGKKAGLCFADVSTGTAHITELAADKIAPAVITELCRFHPSEVLMNPGLLDCREVTAYIKKNMTCSVELVEDERYAPGLVAASLESQFGRDWPQTTGMAENGLVRFAMAALLEYLHDTQIKGVERLKTVVTYNEAQFMRLSPVTRANLELTETLRGREKRGTLLWVLDKTSTAMGKRMLRSWIEQPLLSSKLINQRLNAVESLVRQTVVRGDLTDELHYIADMERLMTRTVYGSATPKEIYTLAQTCEHLPVLRARGHRAARRVHPLGKLRVLDQFSDGAVFKLAKVHLPQVLQNRELGVGKQHFRCLLGAQHGGAEHKRNIWILELGFQLLQLGTALRAQGQVCAAADIAAIQVALGQAVADQMQFIIFQKQNLLTDICCKKKRLQNDYKIRTGKKRHTIFVQENTRNVNI